nr:ABC transporter permease [Cochlodiniinecator piscidefendens]
MIVTGDPILYEVVGLSLQVTFSAVAMAVLVGGPLGAILAIGRFPGRGILSVVVSALMGLPPVVVGLGLYMALSQSGPFAVFELLYTPMAMILAQFIIVTPIIAAISRQVLSDLSLEYGETLRALRATRAQTIATLLWEARPGLLTATLAGLGRAFAEVGAVMIVGGNINHVTRVMTTSIALETSKGELAMAMGLGIILLILSFGINAALMGVRGTQRARAYG